MSDVITVKPLDEGNRGLKIAVFGAGHAGKTILWAMVHKGPTGKSRWRVTSLESDTDKASIFIQSVWKTLYNKRKFFTSTIPKSFDVDDMCHYLFTKDRGFFERVLLRVTRLWRKTKSTRYTVSFTDLSGEWFKDYDSAIEESKKLSGKTEKSDIYKDYLSKCDGLVYLIEYPSLNNWAYLGAKFQASLQKLKSALNKSHIDIPTILCISKADSLYCSKKTSDENKDLFKNIWDFNSFLKKNSNEGSGSSQLLQHIRNHYESDKIKICYLSALGVVNAERGKNPPIHSPNVMRGQGGELRWIFNEKKINARSGWEIEVKQEDVFNVFLELFKMIERSKRAKGAR